MYYKKRTRIISLFLALALTVIGVFSISAEPAIEAGTDYIIKLKDGVFWNRKNRNVPFDVVSEDIMIQLRDSGLLEWYEPDGEMELADAEGAAYYDETEKWDLAMINADAAFAGNTVGQGMRIGVVDSGINPHPALSGSLIAGSNYQNGADVNDTSDIYGHGTQVAGLIAGQDENGFIGVAPGAKLIPLKITDGKGVLTSTVCTAIYAGIDDFDCDILNLSLGIRYDSKALQEVVEYAEQKGVTIVSAVGNNGNAGLFYPARYETVIGVGAVDETGAVYYKSNQNDSVFLTAPGANVKTTGRSGGYTNASGTSFAVPYVTAAIAVLRGIDSSLDPQEIRSLLSLSATDRGEKGRDKGYGWGIVNIAESIRMLAEKKPDAENCPKDEGCPMTGFTDLDKNKWYHDGIHWALDEGVMSGTGADIFSPDMATSRAMLVTMLRHTEGDPEPDSTKNAFTDVESGKWYEKAVLWAAEKKITAGTSATTFSPNDALTREQLATFLYRYAEYKGLDVSERADLAGYTDAGSISDFAKDKVRWAVASGIISGTSKTTLSPKKSASRAEVATMLMNFLKAG